MQDSRSAREQRAALARVVAYRHDIVELHVAQLVDALGTLSRNIDSAFSHDANGVRVETVRLDPGGVRLDHVAAQMARPALGHLAAAGVTRTEEHDFQLR